MEWVNIDLILDIFEFLVTMLFLVLSYKFSALAKNYNVIAFKQISFGFRLMFFAYFAPIIGAFISSTLFSETKAYFEIVFMVLPYIVLLIVALIYFFKSVKSIIKYADE